MMVTYLKFNIMCFLDRQLNDSQVVVGCLMRLVEVYGYLQILKKRKEKSKLVPCDGQSCRQNKRTNTFVCNCVTRGDSDQIRIRSDKLNLYNRLVHMKEFTTQLRPIL